MGCISPQGMLNLGGGSGFTDCGICEGCRSVAKALELQRRKYWLKKRRFHNA